MQASPYRLARDSSNSIAAAVSDKPNKIINSFFINSRGFCHISVRDYFPRFEGCLTYGQPSCSCPLLIYEYQQDHSRTHRTNWW